MKKRHVTSRGILGAGLATVMGLALLTPSGPAHSVAEPAGPASGSYIVEGQFFNSPPTMDCKDVGKVPVCSYEIKGHSVASDGERYKHTIIGTSHGSAKAPNDKSRNQSYVIWEFDDGSTAVMKSQGVTAIDENGQLNVAGTQVCVGGTGRFANVDCAIDWLHAGRNDGRDGGTYEGIVMPKSAS